MPTKRQASFLRSATWQSGLSLLFVTCVLLSGCGALNDDTVDVFAAASLSDAFGEIREAFESEHPHIRVRLNLAGSATLRAQVDDGASADVFASANHEVMRDVLDSAGSGREVRSMAQNRLVLAVPADNPGGVRALADLADEDLLVGMCAVGVPCGDLGQQWLDGNNIEVAADTVEAGVRAVSSRLTERELDAALIYASDVVASHGALRQVATEPGPATDYPIVAFSDAGDTFVDFVVGETGQAILRRWGFGT